MYKRQRGASGNNLQNVDVEFPLGILTCVTGVSGGGKSTLVIQTLQKSLSKILNGNSSMPSPYKSINGISQIDKIIDIDQSPIGRTPRSNPATYTELLITLEIGLLVYLKQKQEVIYQVDFHLM